MSTRSFVGYALPDGTVQYVYIHYDGYLEGVGAYIKNCLTAVEEVADFVKDGDRSTFNEPYNEDGETSRPRVSKSVSDYFEMTSAVYYVYLFMNGEWFYATRNTPDWRKL